MAITEQELKQAHSDHKATYGGVVEDYYGVLYLEKTFGLKREDALTQVTFGGHDYGIDAYHFDAATGNLYIFQFKWSKNVALFRDSLKRLAESGLAQVFAAPVADQKRNPLIDFLRSELDEKRPLIRKVLIHFIFSGDATEADRSATLEHLRENLEAKKYLLNDYFGREIDLTVEFRSSATKTVGARVKVASSHTYDLQMSSHLTQTGPSGEVMHVGFVPLLALRTMFVAMGGRFFERNIRFSLPEETAPNRAISKALKEIVLDGKQAPTVFVFNHNGVTLHAERVSIHEGTLKITEPRLLNGAQSVTTLDNFIKRYSDHPAIKQGTAGLEKIQVLARVVSQADSDFVTTVTLNNNRQNPVQPWALRANDLIQLQLADQFRSELGIFYERQENAFESYTAEDKEEMDIKHDRSIEIRHLALTFLASEGQVERMANPKEFFENDNFYREIFDSRRLKANFRHVILCYKIRQRLNTLTREIEYAGPNKYYFASRSRNLVWALLCQAILNEPKLDTVVEKYSDNLTIEVNFTEWLRELTRRRILPILREAIERAPFSEYVAEQKQDFVRTRAFYDRCLEIGISQFKWVKKYLR